ncbi:RNA processing protein [Tulasnella sp. JGI-2019a]|nr:RNA processing protein [Tulasnella sp. JGI-2019a]KAG8992763.1 RNA processing protein [Tulasnella sp. JGI-2019a]KAG9030724.1 RNA processing protein [Tulasnella sp. JGI-2019a]
MLPLSLLNAAQNKPMLVELKNGETFNGHLVNCDNFMNVTLREVYQTSPEGDRFWKLKECYIRGSTIKYLRVPDALLDAVKEEQAKARDASRGARGGTFTRGARGGRGDSHGARGANRGGGRGGAPERGGGRGGRGRGRAS